MIEPEEELADAQVPGTPKISRNCADVSDTTPSIRRQLIHSPLFSSSRSPNTSPRSPRHEHEKWKGLGNRSRSFGNGQLVTNEKMTKEKMKMDELVMKDKKIKLLKLELEILEFEKTRNNHQTEAGLRQMQQNDTLAQMNFEQITLRAKLKENSSGEENPNKRNEDPEITRLYFKIEQLKLEIEKFEIKRENDTEYGKEQRRVEILKMHSEETVRKREHEYNMTKLEHDSDLASKTKALEIMRCRAEIEKEKSKRHRHQIDDNVEARKHKEEMAKLKLSDVGVLEEIQRMFCVESERNRLFLQQMKQNSEPSVRNAATLGMLLAVAFGVALAHALIIIWVVIRGLQK